MFKKMLISIFCVFSIFYSQNSFSQEIAKERTTEYTLNLNKVKTQAQVDSLTQQTLNINYVQSAKFDWNTYQIIVRVGEGGSKASLSMAAMKKILLKNDIALVKFTKKEIK